MHQFVENDGLRRRFRRLVLNQLAHVLLHDVGEAVVVKALRSVADEVLGRLRQSFVAQQFSAAGDAHHAAHIRDELGEVFQTGFQLALGDGTDDAAREALGTQVGVEFLGQLHHAFARGRERAVRRDGEVVENRVKLPVLDGRAGFGNHAVDQRGHGLHTTAHAGGQKRLAGEVWREQPEDAGLAGHAVAGDALGHLFGLRRTPREGQHDLRARLRASFAGVMQRKPRAASGHGGHQDGDFAGTPATKGIVAGGSGFIAGVEGHVLRTQPVAEKLLRGVEVDFGDARGNQAAEELDDAFDFRSEGLGHFLAHLLVGVPLIHDGFKVAGALTLAVQEDGDATALGDFSLGLFDGGGDFGVLGDALEQVDQVGPGVPIQPARLAGQLRDDGRHALPVGFGGDGHEVGVNRAFGHDGAALHEHAILLQEAASRGPVVEEFLRRRVLGELHRGRRAVAAAEHLATGGDAEVKPASLGVAVGLLGDQLKDAGRPEEVHLLDGLKRRGGGHQRELGPLHPLAANHGAGGGFVTRAVANIVGLVQHQHIGRRRRKALLVVHLGIGGVLNVGQTIPFKGVAGLLDEVLVGGNVEDAPRDAPAAHLGKGRGHNEGLAGARFGGQHEHRLARLLRLGDERRVVGLLNQRRQGNPQLGAAE